jgi:Fe-S oxidoreductase
VFTAAHDGQGVPPAPFDLARESEKDVAADPSSFGTAAAADLPLFRRLSLDACTSCGRCQAVCPAFASDKPLSPMRLVLELRDSARANPETSFWERVRAEEVQSCTTCGACVAECPVDIDHIGLVAGLRRDLVYEGRLREGHQRALGRLAENGNPWGQPLEGRGVFASAERFAEAKEGEHYDYLYWLGCAAAYDARAQKVALAVYQLLTRAGLKVSVLGSRERCTGDVARRVGEEGLFQRLALENIEALRQVDAGAIVTHCPHCLQTLRNEYALLGARFEVLHHTEVLARLLAEGRLEASRALERSVTFHDPCYLGRHNGVFAAPREVLSAVPSLDVREMERSGDRSFCCGAGGGMMWLDADWGRRINVMRTEQALGTGAQTIATACPFCTAMLEEGVQLTGVDTVEVKDVAELLAESSR